MLNIPESHKTCSTFKWCVQSYEILIRGGQQKAWFSIFTQDCGRVEGKKATDPKYQAGICSSLLSFWFCSFSYVMLQKHIPCDLEVCVWDCNFKHQLITQNFTLLFFNRKKSLLDLKYLVHYSLISRESLENFGLMFLSHIVWPRLL